MVTKIVTIAMVMMAVTPVVVFKNECDGEAKLLFNGSTTTTTTTTRPK